MKKKWGKLIAVIVSMTVILTLLSGMIWAEEDAVDPGIADMNIVDPEMEPSADNQWNDYSVVEDPGIVEQVIEDSEIANAGFANFRVGENEFYDLMTAFAVAGAGGRITLLNDIALANQVDVWLYAGEPAVLDLNGHTIYLYSDGEEPGIDNSGAEYSGTGGVITLRSGSLIVTDGSEAKNGRVNSLNGTWPVFRLIQNDEANTSLRIEAGNYQIEAADLIVFVDAEGNTVTEPVDESMSAVISGGSFNREFPESFLADGSEMTQSEDGSWNVQSRQEEQPESTEEQPESQPVEPESTEEQPESQPVEPESTEEQQESQPVEPESTEEPAPVLYSVTFDVAAEDAVTPDGQTVEEGRNALDPGNPVREGYAFDGWFLDGEDTPFDFASRPINNNIVLRARWTKNVFTVAFVLNHEGAEGQPEAQQVTVGQTVVKPNDPSASDVIFGYWTLQENPEIGPAAGSDEEAGGSPAPEAYDFSAPVNEDLTLYGYWTALPEYTITFDAGEGSGEMDAVTVTGVTNYTLPACAFSAPEGKRFAAWDKGAPGDVITVDADTILIAQWENIPVYTISFYSNGGTGDMRPVTMYEGSSFVLPDCAFTAPAGKIFASWDKGAAGDTIVIEGDLSIYAQWAEAPIVTCTVSFDANGGSGTMEPVTVKQGEPFIIPACGFAPPEGKIFAGWDKGTMGSVITVGEDTVLQAIWTEETPAPSVFSVTFYTALGTTPAGQLVQEGQKVVKPEDPAASGYLFRGWYMEIECRNSYDFNAPVNRNLTLYAKWEEEPSTKQFFTVAFYTERGGAPAQQSVEGGQLAVKPADPSAQGFVFDGWYTEKECKTLYDFNTPVTANLTLFAGWSEAPVQSCVVYFHSNGHGNTPNPQPVMAGQHVQKPEDPKATGYTFTGWFLDVAGTKAFNFQSPITQDVTLYAGWTPNRYTVRFDANEGAGTMSILSCVYGTRTTLPADTFTRSGYSFVGWNTQADGSGTNYTDQAIVLNLSNTNGGVVPLYAQWKNNYSVIEGGNAVVPREGSAGITFRVDGDYTKFTGISIDGREVSTSQYTSWAGSTYVRLNRDYVNQMSEGDHTVKFLYTDGSVETNFDVVTASPAPTVRTRNNTLLWVIIIIIVLAIVACTIVIILIRRRSRERY